MERVKKMKKVNIYGYPVAEQGHWVVKFFKHNEEAIGLAYQEEIPEYKFEVATNPLSRDIGHHVYEKNHIIDEFKTDGQTYEEMYTTCRNYCIKRAKKIGEELAKKMNCDIDVSLTIRNTGGP